MPFRLRAPHAHELALAAIVGFGAWLRLWHLDLPFWWDEVASWSTALGGPGGSPQEAPVTAWASLLSMAIARSTSLFAFRFPHALAGTLAIVVVYALGTRLGSRRVGLIAAAVLATSPLAYLYARLGRPYGFLALTTALLLLAAVESHARDTRRAWLAYAGAVAAALATHLVALQIVVAIGAFWGGSCLRRLRRREPVAGATVARLGAATLVGCAVGLSWLLVRPSMASVIEGPHPRGWWVYVREGVSGLMVGNQTPTGWVVAFVVASAILALMGGLWPAPVGTPRGRGLLLLAVFVSMALVYLTLGAKGYWTNWARYLTGLTAPLAVLIALGIEALCRRSPVAWLAGAAVAAGALLATPTWVHPRVRDPRVHHQLSRAVVKHDLDGVVAPAFVSAYSEETDRDLVLFVRDRDPGDQSPLYYLRDGVVTLVGSRPGRFGLGRVPVRGLVVPLKPGAYALLGTWPAPATCSQLERHLPPGMALTSVVRDSMNTCVIRWAAPR